MSDDSYADRAKMGEAWTSATEDVSIDELNSMTAFLHGWLKGSIARGDATPDDYITGVERSRAHVDEERRRRASRGESRGRWAAAGVEPTAPLVEPVR